MFHLNLLMFRKSGNKNRVNSPDPRKMGMNDDN